VSLDVRHIRQPRDPWVSFFLTFFFGPFGLIYASPPAAAIMCGVWAVVLILCLFVVGIFLVPVAFVGELVWAVLACRPPANLAL